MECLTVTSYTPIISIIFKLAYMCLPIENQVNPWFCAWNHYAQIHSPSHLKQLSFELGSYLRLAEGASHFPATST